MHISNFKQPMLELNYGAIQFNPQIVRKIALKNFFNSKKNCIKKFLVACYFVVVVVVVVFFTLRSVLKEP